MRIGVAGALRGPAQPPRDGHSGVRRGAGADPAELSSSVRGRTRLLPVPGNYVGKWANDASETNWHLVCIDPALRLSAGPARRENGLPCCLWRPQRPLPGGQGRESRRDRQGSGGARIPGARQARMGAGQCRAPLLASSTEAGRRGRTCGCGAPSGGAADRQPFSAAAGGLGDLVR